MENNAQDGWIHRFCTRIGNELFCEVDRDFAKDYSNLVGLDEEVARFQKALCTILDKPDVTEVELASSPRSSCQRLDKAQAKSPENLYGLIHARFILSERGSKKMLYKYLQGHFGHCPRVLCGNANVLPIGMSDRLGVEMVKVYCPRCDDIYCPRLLKHCYIDGAYFGTSFPHMLFMVFPEYRPQPIKERYVPRLFGFKIHSSAYQQKGSAQTRVWKRPVTKATEVINGAITRTKITYT